MLAPSFLRKNGPSSHHGDLVRPVIINPIMEDKGLGIVVVYIQSHNLKSIRRELH